MGVNCSTDVMGGNKSKRPKTSEHGTNENNNTNNTNNTNNNNGNRALSSCFETKVQFNVGEVELDQAELEKDEFLRKCHEQLQTLSEIREAITRQLAAQEEKRLEASEIKVSDSKTAESQTSITPTTSTASATTTITDLSVSTSPTTITQSTTTTNNSTNVTTNNNTNTATKSDKPDKSLIIPDQKQIRIFRKKQKSSWYPLGVWRDPARSLLFVSDDQSQVTVYHSSTGKYLSKFGARGTGPGKFQKIYGLCQQPITNNIVVADWGNHRAQVLCSQGKHIYSLGQEGKGYGQFNSPSSVACNARGDIFVADSQNHRIQIFDAQGRFLRSFGSFGSEKNQLYFPRAICIDQHGRLLVAEYSNVQISVWNSDARETVSTIPVRAKPRGICVDNDGNILVSTLTLKRFDFHTGRLINELGSVGSQVGQFNYPTGICVDQDNNLFVADGCNHRVQVIPQ